MNSLKKCTPLTTRHFYQMIRACILIACSLLLGCSTIISHSQSGDEPDIHAKRTLGTSLDDKAIVGTIDAKLRKLNEQFAAMVKIDSYNKIVLLTGRVPDKSFVSQAVDTASRIPGVRQVHSEISHGEPTTISNYWYDAWLTTKVKSQLTLTSNSPASKTKVRSFAGYVYLMGVMTPQEAKNAIYVASRVSGAKKVVSMIETIDHNGNTGTLAEQQKPAEASVYQIDSLSTGTDSHNSDFVDDENSHFIAPIELESTPLESTPLESTPLESIPLNNGQHKNKSIKNGLHENNQAQGLYNEYQTNYQQPSTVNPKKVEGLQ